MRWNRRTDGAETLYLRDDEIERILEDELLKSGLMPTAENLVVDVEAFIERHLDAKLDSYATLPRDVLGETQFLPREKPQVKINQDLTGLADEYNLLGDVGRLRATLAHEASHVLLHRIEFEFGQDQGILFKPEGERPGDGERLMRCA